MKKTYIVMISMFFLSRLTFAVDPDMIVTIGETVNLSATASDKDCHFKTGQCPHLETDSAITITWSAVWKGTSTPAGSFPNGSTGSSVTWIAPCTPGDVTVTATASNANSTKAVDGGASDSIWVRVTDDTITIQDLSWEVYQDNESLISVGGGKGIFPGRKSPADTGQGGGRYIRNLVYIKAKVNTVCGKTVYFKWFDVDDPSDSPIIDTNGGNGVDNFSSASGNDDFDFTHVGLGTTDSNGEVRLVFEVGFSPGDNYKIFADLESYAWSLTQGQVDSGIIPPGISESPMLTVCRKLWIERDSMSAVALTGDEKNLVEGDAHSCVFTPIGTTQCHVELDQNLPGDFDDENQFEFGSFIVNAQSYTVISSTGKMFGNDEIVISGRPGTIVSGYQLFDDDVNNSLPALSLSVGNYSSEFENKAYIFPEYLDSSYSDLVTFYKNLGTQTINLPLGDWSDDYDCTSTSTFWTMLVVAGFQQETGTDMDPDDEVAGLFGGAVFGQCCKFKNACMIFRETIKDAGGVDEDRIVAHEIIHKGGNWLHCPESCGCIMTPEADGGYICDQTVYNLRSTGY